MRLLVEVHQARLPLGVESEDHRHAVEGREQRLDLGDCVVDGERGAGRGGGPERTVQGPRAVVAHAYGHAGVVEHLAHVVGVHAVDDERDGAATGRADLGPDDTDPRAFGETALQQVDERGLVRVDALDAESLDPPDGGGEAHGLGRVGHAGLELLRCRGVRRALHRDEARSSSRPSGTAA